MFENLIACLSFDQVEPTELNTSCAGCWTIPSYCSPYKQQQLRERYLSGDFQQELSKLGPGLYTMLVMLRRRVS